MELSMDLRQYEGYHVTKHIILTHDDLKAVNTRERPQEVAPREGGRSQVSDGYLKGILPARSWNVIRMEKWK